MINQSHSQNLLDWEFLSERSIELLPAQIDRAVRISQNSEPQQQWQAYLNALALSGFEDWLEGWATDLEVDYSQCSVFQPQSNYLLNAISSIGIGRFNVCLVVTTSLADTVVYLPQAVVDLPQSTPHFYVLIEVLEELMQVQIYGFLHGLRLQSQSNSLNTIFDQGYAVPLAWFAPDPTAMLRELRFLQPDTISPTSENTAVAASPLQNLAQTTINTGVWLREQLDRVAQELSWVMMPTFSTAVTFRSSAETAEVRALGIPDEARGAYQDLRLEDVALRLKAIVWELPNIAEASVWTLLIKLEAQPETYLPAGVRLQIHDETDLLVERISEESDYLYAQVGGTWGEQFSVTIALATGTSITLPPFTFNPDA
jgi:hypothetical protein